MRWLPGFLRGPPYSSHPSSHCDAMPPHRRAGGDVAARRHGIHTHARTHARTRLCVVDPRVGAVDRAQAVPRVLVPHLPRRTRATDAPQSCARNCASVCVCVCSSWLCVCEVCVCAGFAHACVHVRLRVRARVRRRVAEAAAAHFEGPVVAHTRVRSRAGLDERPDLKCQCRSGCGSGGRSAGAYAEPAAARAVPLQMPRLETRSMACAGLRPLTHQSELAPMLRRVASHENTPTGPRPTADVAAVG